jgi:exonuclease III
MDLADIYRAFHPTEADYTFFSAEKTHRAFSKLDHIMGHKANLN